MQLDPALAVALRQDLEAAGALQECDHPDHLSDVPLQTLTVFRAGSTRRANTFSWLASDGNLGTMQGLLDDFIAAHFAPLPDG
ncbi:MAG TPA: hypothetical protein VF530_07685 [Planctomycetota bacterium]